MSSRASDPVKRLRLVLASAALCALLAPFPSDAFPSSSPARWIWTPYDHLNAWVAFRKVQVLGAAPTSALTYIAADSKYWLWVNGRLVVFEGGLKRGPNRRDTYVDVLDLAPYLQSGTNVLALLVWHFGRTGKNHIDSGASGLIFQSDILVNDTYVTLTSDTTWKARAHHGYAHDTSEPQPNTQIFAEWNTFYDARNATVLEGWQNPGFDDSGWPFPIDKGGPGDPPWNELIRRPIPLFRFSGLLDYVNRNSIPSHGNGEFRAVLPANLQLSAWLKIDAPAGVRIGIQSDHYTDGGPPNVRATYLTKAGVQQFEWLSWCSGTAIIYNIPSSVRILELKYRESGFETDFTGSFVSDDPFCNRLWTKAARTDYLCLRDTFMDCPTRERNQWWGDVVNQMKQGFYTFDTNFYSMGKKGISEMVAWAKPGGILGSVAPGAWDLELPSQSLAMVWSFWTYYLYSGDADTVLAAYPAARTYLNLYAFDSDGLVEHRKGDWAWYDWDDNIDVRVLDNALYYLALDSALKLAALGGHTADVQLWTARKASLQSNFNRVFWDAVEYRSPGYTLETDDRANALAVVAGLAGPSKYAYLINVLRRYRHASPFTEAWVLEALHLMNAPLDGQDRMRRFANMVDDPGYTLWEFWNKAAGTDNHAWAGGAQYILSAYSAGVRPLEPGYRSYIVRPQMGHLNRIAAVVPTIKGSIHLKLERDLPWRFSMLLTSPQGTTARVGIPLLLTSHSSITANGVTIYANGSATAGLPGIGYLGTDHEYIYFAVQPGTWLFHQLSGGTAPNLAPRLNANRASDRITLSWPVLGSYTLFSTENLSPPVYWSPVTNSPSNDSISFSVEVPVSGAPRFFRLLAQ